MERIPFIAQVTVYHLPYSTAAVRIARALFLAMRRSDQCHCPAVDKRSLHGRPHMEWPTGRNAWSTSWFFYLQETGGKRCIGTCTGALLVSHLIGFWSIVVKFSFFVFFSILAPLSSCDVSCLGLMAAGGGISALPCDWHVLNRSVYRSFLLHAAEVIMGM